MIVLHYGGIDMDTETTLDINENEKAFVDTLFGYMNKLADNEDTFVFVTRTDKSDSIPFVQSMKHLGKYMYTFYFFDKFTLDYACHDLNMPFNYGMNSKLTVSITPVMGKIEIKFNSKHFGLIGGEPCYQTIYLYGWKAHGYLKTNVANFVKRIEVFFNGNNSSYPNYSEKNLKTIERIFEPYVKGEETL